MFIDAISWGAFWADPIAYFKDPDSAKKAYVESEIAKGGQTPTAEIPAIATDLEEKLSDPLGVNNIIGNIGEGIKNVWSGVTGTVKMLPLALMALIVGISLYLIFMGRKGKTLV